ncbi:MAG: hypothetical protein L0332_00115 [Chloroflexi bacterium]|nr:hypothetical protein [Chloroflexota bacterium]MCI0649834.1 hypothetical protein [Chloroflexota bacterium]MCI0725127.1 hypothetical protein [Chloroflexota bacterium]
MTHDSYDWGPEEPYWPEMVAALVEFGLARSTAMRLVGLPHVTKEMVDRWLAYCKLRGPASRHGGNAFLITRLSHNDIPAPSWGALRRLAQRLEQANRLPHEEETP